MEGSSTGSIGCIACSVLLCDRIIWILGFPFWWYGWEKGLLDIVRKRWIRAGLELVAGDGALWFAGFPVCSHLGPGRPGQTRIVEVRNKT